MGNSLRDGQELFGGRNWFILVLVGLFGQIAWTVENMYLNLFVYQTITDNPDVIAAMVAASAIVATLTTIVMGAVSDHTGKRKVFISAGYVIWGLSVIVFAFIRPEKIKAVSPAADAVRVAAILIIVADCIMTFFGSTANDAAFNAWVTDKTVPANRGRVQGILSVLPLISMLIVFGLFDPLTQKGRWDLFFLLIGLLTIAAGIVSFPFLDDSSIKADRTSLREKLTYGFKPEVIRKHPRLYRSLLLLLLVSIAAQIYMPYLIIYIQNYLQIKNYAILLGIVLIGASAISVFAGRLIDRSGKVTVAFPAVFVQLAGLAGMFLVRDMAGACAAGLIMMSGFMVLLACTNGLVQDEIPEGSAGRFQGIRMIAAVMIPMIVGPFIGSIVIRQSTSTYVELGVVRRVPTPGIFLASAVVLFSVFYPLMLLQRDKKRKADQDRSTNWYDTER
jgi:MFS family permease